VLHGRDVLAGVHRVDAIIVVGREHQEGRVGRAWVDLVERGVAPQPLELFRVVGGAVLADPGGSCAEAGVADHVEQRDRADDRAEELGTLGGDGADEEAAVGAAADRQA